MAETGRDRREFERYVLQFEVEVSDAMSGVLLETSSLQDISGGGLSFVSHHDEPYVQGQELHLLIRLPETDTMSACMRGRGIVVWIGKENTESGRLVGVELFEPLQFEQQRLDRHKHHVSPDTGQ